MQWAAALTAVGLAQAEGERMKGWLQVHLAEARQWLHMGLGLFREMSALAGQHHPPIAHLQAIKYVTLRML